MIVDWTRIVAVEKKIEGIRNRTWCYDIWLKRERSIKKGPTKFLAWVSGWVKVTIY